MSHTFSLLETILYEPDNGFYLLDLHVARLLRSARSFLDQQLLKTVPVDADFITRRLKDTVPDTPMYKRVRLLLDDRDVRVEYNELPTPQHAYETLDAAAQQPLESCLTIALDSQASPVKNNPFIENKTTHRDIYNEARARARCGEPDGPFDVVLWNEDGHVTETSIANIAVLIKQEDGSNVWRTPGVGSGLLPGVFREHLLQSVQKVQTGTITAGDLVEASKQRLPIICFNAVRKAYRVRLI